MIDYAVTASIGKNRDVTEEKSGHELARQKMEERKDKETDTWTRLKYLRNAVNDSNFLCPQRKIPHDRSKEKLVPHTLTSAKINNKASHHGKEVRSFED